MRERFASVIEELGSRYGTRVSTSESVLDKHGRDELIRQFTTTRGNELLVFRSLDEAE